MFHLYNRNVFLKKGKNLILESLNVVEMIFSHPASHLFWAQLFIYRNSDRVSVSPVLSVTTPVLAALFYAAH